MALRKIVASRYTWLETGTDGVTHYYAGNLGEHYDFGAGEITRGEGLGALAAADGGATGATKAGSAVAVPVTSFGPGVNYTNGVVNVQPAYIGSANAAALEAAHPAATSAGRFGKTSDSHLYQSDGTSWVVLV